MGIYYNRSLVEKVPTLWSTFSDVTKTSIEDIKEPESENNNLLTVSSPKNTQKEAVAFTNL